MANIQSGYLKTKNGIQLMTTVPYPIGAIYLSIDNTNPSKLFGGTWKQIAQGRTLVGVDTSQTEFNTVQKTGGEKTHTLVIDEIPAHNHIFHQRILAWDAGWPNSVINPSYEAGNIQWQSHNKDASMMNTGGSQSHNNLQPYYTCYIWLRTA